MNSEDFQKTVPFCYLYQFIKANEYSQKKLLLFPNVV